MPRLATCLVGMSVTVGLLAERTASAKTIALEAAPGSCVTAPGDVYARATTLLTARGHTVTVVAGTDLDSAAKIGAFDAVVMGAGAFGCAWDWSAFDGVLAAYVNGGGGLLMTGWGAYYMADNPKTETYPGLEAVLPVTKGTAYSVGGALTVVAGHPIVAGVQSFTSPDYNSYGAGTPNDATVFLTVGANNAGAAWSKGTGRSVYLAPTYLANWGDYANESLLDGTDANAQELFLRAVDWTAFAIGVAKISAPATLDLGSAALTQTAQASFTISNPGDATLTVTALAVSGTNGAEFTSGQALPFDVPAAGSKAVPITFAPAAVGARTAKVTLSSNAAKTAPVEITLTGTGTMPSPITPDGGSSGGSSSGSSGGSPDAGSGSSSGGGSSSGAATPEPEPAGAPSEDTSGGCGCRTASSDVPSLFGGAILGAAVLLARRRRARR